jgi:trimethylamine:corrinoid methyltransferase-like protein
MNMALFFAAMYHSESWYEHWRITGNLHSKARAIVLFDRVLNERIT